MIQNLPANEGDVGSIPGLGRSSGEGNGNPIPVFLPGESHRQTAWWAAGHVATAVFVVVVQSLGHIGLFATHGQHHARLLCPSLSTGAYSNSCLLSQ